MIAATLALSLTLLAAEETTVSQAMRNENGKLHIAHEYRDGPARKHHWNSGWLSEAVERLVE